MQLQELDPSVSELRRNHSSGYYRSTVKALSIGILWYPNPALKTEVKSHVKVVNLYQYWNDIRCKFLYVGLERLKRAN